MVVLRVLVVYLRTRGEQRGTAGIYLRNSSDYIILRIMCVSHAVTLRGLNKKNK